MTLGIFLATGDSFKDMAKTGQDVRFKKFYLSAFAKEFSKVYVFSYTNEKVNDLPRNVILVANKYALHRYLYGFLMPIINIKYVLDCDVIRAYHLSGTIPAIISRIFLGKPFIFNWAYDYPKFAQIENKNLQAIFFKLLSPLAIFFSSKIFAANKPIFKELPKSKAIYLPNGVDTNFFRPTKIKPKHKRIQVLSVGRLEKQKNFENLIKAMSKVNADLTIVGSGSLKSHLMQIAKQQKVNLKIIDKVENTKMPKIYNQADIFVLPSYLEGSPKVLMEAMACGLPVVATDNEGNKDIINNGENGLLVNESIEGLSSGIKTILENKNLMEKLRKKARKKIEKDFSLTLLLRTENYVLKHV